MKMISSYISQDSVLASKTSNANVIDKIGDAVLRRVVISILEGGNVRDLTEAMTRKRILLNNAALLCLYFKMLGENQALESTLSKQIGLELGMKDSIVPQYKKDVLRALVGMTKKGSDNILRGEKGKKDYLDKLDKSLREIEKEICEEYGSYEAEFIVGDQRLKLPTRSLLRCMMAVGSQTLTIRGSEKSTYGKLFEHLVLGSVLTILGFRKIDKDDLSDTRMIFWLSDAKNKRECDATAILSPGACVRFDIGFIGRGNTEISLDKVSRYDRFLELKSGGKKCKVPSHTIIIVDTIGENSKAWSQSTEIGGDIIQMNGCYWVKELADKIRKIYRNKFVDPLAKLTQSQSLAFIEERMKDIDFKPFLSAGAVKNND